MCVSLSLSLSVCLSDCLSERNMAEINHWHNQLTLSGVRGANSRSGSEGVLADEVTRVSSLGSSSS